MILTLFVACLTPEPAPPTYNTANVLDSLREDARNTFAKQQLAVAATAGSDAINYGVLPAIFGDQQGMDVASTKLFFEAIDFLDTGSSDGYLTLDQLKKGLVNGKLLQSTVEEKLHAYDNQLPNVTLPIIPYASRIEEVIALKWPQAYRAAFKATLSAKSTDEEVKNYLKKNLNELADKLDIFSEGDTIIDSHHYVCRVYSDGIEILEVASLSRHMIQDMGGEENAKRAVQMLVSASKSLQYSNPSTDTDVYREEAKYLRALARQL